MAWALWVLFLRRDSRRDWGREIRVMAEGERDEDWRRKRDSERGQLPFPNCGAKETGDPADLVIMAVKDMGLEQAVRDISIR